MLIHALMHSAHIRGVVAVILLNNKKIFFYNCKRKRCMIREKRNLIAAHSHQPYLTTIIVVISREKYLQQSISSNEP
jgi:hypothetical protein